MIIIILVIIKILSKSFYFMTYQKFRSQIYLLDIYYYLDISYMNGDILLIKFEILYAR